MNRFMAFVRKEFLHIFRDWRSMLVLLAYPVILVLLFGFAVTTEVKNVRVGILDMSEDGITRKIVDRIAANPYMTVVSQTKDIRTIYDNFDRGKTDVALVLGNNFANDLLHSGSASVQILVDGTEPNQAVIRQQYVSGILSAVARDEYGNHADTRPTINVVTRMLYNPQQKSEYNFVPGVIGMVLLIVCAMMSSMSIVREKETGTMEVLLASPLQPWCIVTAKLIPYFVISSSILRPYFFFHSTCLTSQWQAARLAFWESRWCISSWPLRSGCSCQLSSAPSLRPCCFHCCWLFRRYICREWPSR